MAEAQTSDWSKEIFGKEDADLFNCDDLDLKYKAIRNSIIPRLLEIVHGAIADIEKVFGIDPLAISHIAFSPYRTESRGEKFKLDTSCASAGLMPKRGKTKFKLIDLRIELNEHEIFPWMNIRADAFDDGKFAKFGEFFVEHEKSILELLVATKSELMFWTKNRHEHIPIFPVCKSMKKLIESPQSNIFLDSVNFAGTIHAIGADKLKVLMVMLFPLYHAAVEFAYGRGCDDFEKKVSQAFEYREAKGKEWTAAFRKINKNKIKSNAADHVDMTSVGELAEKHVKVPVGKRWQVFERDNWRCVSCGRGADDGAILEVDHILPRSKGGADSLDNYQTLCRECNIGKSNKSSQDLRRRK